MNVNGDHERYRVFAYFRPENQIGDTKTAREHELYAVPCAPFLFLRDDTTRIFRDAARNRRLSEEGKKHNPRISRIRYAVEQGFGVLKRRYRFERARYLGRIKTEMEFHLNALAFNIRKALLLLS